MKKSITVKLNNLYTALIIGCLLIGTSGCGDDEDPIPTVPEISISAPGLTITDGVINVGVTKDSVITLSYSVDAPGLIVELEQTVDGTSETISAAEDEDSYTKQMVVNVPFENTTIEVELKVTDQHEQTATESVTIQIEALVPPATPMTESQLITMGGAASPTEPSRWDFDAVIGYTFFSINGDDGEEAENRATVDAFYNHLSLKSTDENLFEDSGARFLITDFTKVEFDAMEDDAALKDLNIDQDYLQNIEVGQVIAFVTPLGTKGLLYLKEYYEGSDDLDAEIKLQEL